jgi:hypothetical protein
MEEFYLKKRNFRIRGILFEDKPSLKQHFLDAREKNIVLIKQLSADEHREICKMRSQTPTSTARSPWPRK